MGLVLAPLIFALESLHDVEHRGVLASMVLVHRRLSVVGEDVVDVASPLGDVGLGSIFPALAEELLHVVVGDVLFGRHEVHLGRGPRQVIARSELARVPRKTIK